MGIQEKTRRRMSWRIISGVHQNHLMMILFDFIISKERLWVPLLIGTLSYPELHFMILAP